MKTVSRISVAVALATMIYPSSSWAIDWEDDISHISGSGNAFTATDGQLGFDKGKLTQLRVARNGLRKNTAALSRWAGLISFTFVDNGETSVKNCAYKDKTGDKRNGFYIFNVR